MKKTTKRIFCGVLSLMMTSTLVLEHTLSSATTGLLPSGNTAASVTFKDVTGQFDTSKLMESYFNDSVLKSEDSNPRYETRTVVVTLSGDNVIEAASGEAVSEFLSTNSGQRAAENIAIEQDHFLNSLTKKKIPYQLVRSYNTVLNGVAIEIDTQYVSLIKEMAGVESVVITTAYSEPKTVATAEGNSDLVTNETNVYATGIYNSSDFVEEYGEDMVVAVLDTGLDYTHPAFQHFQSENPVKAWDRDYVKGKLEDPNFELSAEIRSGALEVSDVYVSDKVPFAYDYADDDPDVYPSYSNHGTHVAGIIGGYDTNGYTDKEGNHVAETFKGVVPDAQLAIFKVFTDDLDDPDLGGAVAEDIIAALDDCVKLGVDVINMSLGTSCGFTTTNDGDDEGEMLNAVYESIKGAGISLVCAASNDYSAGYGGVYGTNLASNPDSSTVGSPSTFASALSVASVNGQKASYMVANEGEKQSYVFYEESRDINGNPFDFYEDLNERYPQNNGEFEYVVIPGVGKSYSSTTKRLLQSKDEHGTGRIALIKRGENTFQEKVEMAMEMGAIGVIIYNNVAGVIRMNLGEIDDPVPTVSINMNAGNAMVKGAVGSVGKIKLSNNQKAGPFMSEFSSWGPTHDLGLKPEITAHGGEITSTVPGGYGEQSGTSMASPNMAGFMALVRSYIMKDLGITDPIEINRLAMQLVMSTATTAYDQEGLPYSPRKQGAGLARMERVIGGTSAYLWTEEEKNDYRPKLELGEDEEKTGVYEMSFMLTNFGETELSFTTDQLIMTETLSSDGLTVSEQAYMLNNAKTEWKENGVAVGEQIRVAAKETKKISVTITLTEKEKEYIDESFENGMYVEGYLKLKAKDSNQCDLSIPFLAFYGDWEAAPMLDYTAFEVAENEQDGSVKEEDKIKASVWETQPYASFYNEKYILPMGGYVYLLPDDADPVYVDEDKCSVSRYNTYYGEGNNENYMTSTAIKAVYAGLLRNARIVKYRMYDVATGELVLEDVCNRVGKAYAGGGSGTPANVQLDLSPEEEELLSNGKYRMEFDFFMDGDAIGVDEEGNRIFPDHAAEENTYEFSFTVDYEAPVMQDVRVRYYNYEDRNTNTIKQRIYLDVDVYDNHYAQALMLCYPKTDKNGEVSLMLATEFPTPIRNAKENGTSTVSVEITDIYEKYGSTLYVQLDDYSINTCLYQINISEANKDSISDVKEFDLVGDDKLSVKENGEGELTLNMYEKYQVNLTNVGSGNLSNFVWSSEMDSVAAVKNGEIVGLQPGTTSVMVSTGSGMPKIINVTVTETENSIVSLPSVSFGIIKTNQEALTPAVGAVKVNAGESFALPLQLDPWYHPMTNLRVVWSSSNPSVATVDEEGNVETLKKGTAIILANLERKKENGEWEKTLYSASVTLRVQNEFNVSSYNLLSYDGVGYNAWICPDCGEAWVEKELVSVTIGEGENATKQNGCCPDCNVVCTQSYDVLKIPTDMNVWYIGEEAFKDNDTIKKIIIPSTVLNINPRAFMNCTALEEVYFVSLNHRVEDGEENVNIDWADLTMVYEQAFYGCKNLKKIDLSNVKTITVAQQAFYDCTSLEEVVAMPNIGTMHHYAFANTALKEADLTGLHMSGYYVFANCTQLQSIQTSRFTAIGEYMFYGCTNLHYSQTAPLVLSTPKIGNGAFSQCTNLAAIKLDSLGADIVYEIGERAFEYCGSTRVDPFTINFNGERVRVIGNRAFAGSTIQTFAIPTGLEVFGADVFANTALTTLVVDNGLDLDTLRFLGVPFAGITIELAETNSDRYALEGNVLYTADFSKVLHVNPDVTSLTLKESVVEIGAYAFAGSKIARITLGENLSKIGVGAFMNSALEEVLFNGTEWKEIPDYAFYGTKISSIVLPESVTKIGAYAFADSSLNTFSAAGLQEIGDYAFADCIALRGVLDADTGRYLLTLAESVTTMGDGVFLGCTNLEMVILPSIEKLGTYTFSGAEKLKKVVFGENASTVGAYTFANTKVADVTIGEKTQSIGENAFLLCENLKEITLPESVKAIERQAFALCYNLKKVNGIENVETFGQEAFYGVEFESLHLEKATKIEDGAFAASRVKNKAQGTLQLPVVEELGDLAFWRTAFSKVILSDDVRVIGYGAFAEMKNLSSIEIMGENEWFFVENGVLYKNLQGEEGGYELVCYPAGLQMEEGYAVKEGTRRIEAYAFYGLSDGALEKVVLPYTVNAIGDSAFFDSGVKEYHFESINAPVLETIFRQDIADQIEDSSTVSYYKGYYYANFETYFYEFTHYVREKSDLILYYPLNGTGYDNYIYTLYFGERYAENVLPEDDTRAFVSMMGQFPTVETLETWKTWDKTEENKAKVVALSEEVKTARRYFNNASTKEDQATFVVSYEEQLSNIESILRDVKKHFDIPIILKGIDVAKNSTHRSDYIAGEQFDMTGLLIELSYDDGSTEMADPSKVTLDTVEPLTKYHSTVKVIYEGMVARVLINVTESELPENEDSSDVEDSSSEESSSEAGGCGSAVTSVMATLTILAASVICLKGKKQV